MYELTPEAAAHWTGVIDRAEPFVRAKPATRPCDYGPWEEGLLELGKLEADWPHAGRYTYGIGVGGLMEFADFVSSTSWPADHCGLVDFALRFLEADVMLFRSGYTKRHLLRRLRRAELDQTQQERCVELIKRAVTTGSGLEEFREFKRLATCVGDDFLRVWLQSMAEGAFLTVDDFKGADYFDVFGRLHEAGKYSYAAWFQSPTDPRKMDVSSLDVVNKKPAGDNRSKRNAWQILYHIQMIERQATNGLPFD